MRNVLGDTAKNKFFHREHAVRTCGFLTFIEDTLFVAGFLLVKYSNMNLLKMSSSDLIQFLKVNDVSWEICALLEGK